MQITLGKLIGTVGLVAVFGFLIIPSGSPVSVDTRFIPKPPAIAYQLSAFRTGPLEVAKVFGRSRGCENASPELIFAVSEQAGNNSIDPLIAAPPAAIESACNRD